MFRKKKKLSYELYSEILNNFGVESSTKDAVGGKTDKIFVRLDSEHLTDYFKAVAKGGSSYVTYIDDIAIEYATTKKAPIRAVSAMIKEYDKSSKYPYNEEIASKIGNALGIPVVYNMSYEAEDRLQCISIDYMKYDKNLEYGTLYPDYNSRIIDGHSKFNLVEWEQVFLSMPLHNPSTGVPITMGQRKKLFKQFLPTYFFRRFVLGDTDFDVQNIGITYDKRHSTYSISPNYDMERAFNMNWSETSILRSLRRDMPFAIKYYPKEMSNFMKKVSSVYANRMLYSGTIKNIKDKKYGRYALSQVYNSMYAMSKVYIEELANQRAMSK